MFYSHDLLGRKSPLGHVWSLAHGRKLRKDQISSINLRELCDTILEPDMPHSLRLQGILIGGLVIVFSKQQAYLLEDLQDMMRKLLAAGKTAAAADEGAGEAGKGGRKGKKGRGTLKGKQANQQAKLEAITLLDMEDMFAPALLGGDDVFGILDGGAGGGSLSDALASAAAAAAAGRGRGAGPGGLGDDLFLVPGTAPSMTTTSAGAGATTTHDADGPPGRQQGGTSRLKPSAGSGRTRTTGGPSGGAPLPGVREEDGDEVYGGGGMQHAWVNPEEEMFEFDDMHLDLMDLGQSPGAAAAGGPAATATTATTATASAGRSLQHQQRSASEAAAAAGVDAFEVMDVDQQMDAEMAEEQQRSELREGALSSPPRSDAQQGRDQDGEGVDGAAAQTPRARAGGRTPAVAAKQQRKRKGGKAKGGAVIIDDLNEMVIRSRTYREWSLDASPLINKALKHGPAFFGGQPSTLLLEAATLPEAALFNSATGFCAGPLATFGAGPARVPGELLELFSGPVAAAAAHRAGQRKAPHAPSSPEVNNSTGIPLPGAAHAGAARRASLDLRPVVPGVSEQDDDHMHHQLHDDDQEELLLMDETSPLLLDQPGQQEQPLVSNDEAHDQLGELPFADLEVERMRAAATPGSSDDSLRNHLQGGGSARRASKGGPETSSTAGGSSLLAGRSRDHQLRGSGLKRRLGSADLGTTGSLDDMDIFFGDGNLADLLPDIELPLEEEQEDAGDQTQGSGDEDEDGEEQRGSGRARGARRGSVRGSLRGSGALTASGPYASSQFQLLEETEPDNLAGPTQQPGGDRGGQLSHTTRVALSIFQQRLQAAGEEGQAAGGVDAGGAPAAAPSAEPSVSFFGLLREGRLSRNQAATLFYQVCVTTTAGFITTAQERAFGDIEIKAGPRMVAAAQREPAAAASA